MEEMNVDSSQTLTHVSLCAGYGGIDLGLRRALGAVRTIAFSEIETFACENLVAKMEAGWLDAAPIWTDLKTFPWASFRGKVDTLSGGFPCQPFSSAGRRAGDDDPRHLWPHIVRGIKRLGRPPLVFFENVEGIISSKLKSDEWADPAGTPVLLHVLRELERLGYQATAGVFSAREVGAPHQRKRVFIMGVRSDLSDTGRALISGMLSATEREDVGNGPRWGIQCSCGRGRLKQKRPQVQDRESSTAYPAPRGAEQYGWEPPRATRQAEPSMGGDADGTPRWVDYAELCHALDNRTDELRLLGNGVVPATAERAFRILWGEIKERPSWSSP
jgi:DNA (cytosine-5)-methyltransferase 1